MLSVEIFLNNRGPSLAAPQVAPDIFDQLGLVSCPTRLLKNSKFTACSKMVRCKDAKKKPGRAVYYADARSGFFRWRSRLPFFNGLLRLPTELLLIS